MKIGIGLYKSMLTAENFRFARQVGCTHVVAHLVDYERGSPVGTHNQPVGNAGTGWGFAGDPASLWSEAELSALRKDVEREGLVLEAIENIDPAFWFDVLLDGPRRGEQVEGVKRLVRNIGAAGIHTLGYNFSIAGVAGRTSGAFARGGARSVGVESVDQTPLPLGMVWNMVYDAAAPAGTLPPITSAQLWDRVDRFLDELLPVAEKAGVTLALHPDDPPAPAVRSTPRLVYRPDLYQRLIDRHPSPSNALEFCVGTIAEMRDGDVYEATERYAVLGRLAYVHLRNVRGKMPSYRETFIDDGDIDVIRILGILKQSGYTGVLIPDHTPLPECASPWHAGMAYAIGFMRAALKVIES
jgi:mannonate dehydratase